MRTADVPAELEEEFRGKTVERSNLQPPVPSVLPPTLNLIKIFKCGQRHCTCLAPLWSMIAALSSVTLSFPCMKVELSSSLASASSWVG